MAGRGKSLIMKADAASTRGSGTRASLSKLIMGLRREVDASFTQGQET